MAIGVNPIQKKDPLQKLLPIAGAVIGGVATGGSPSGALTGAQVGGLGAGILGRGDQVPPQVGAETLGMQRRTDAISQDPLRAIAQAQSALQTLPPDQFPETRRAFDQAMAIARRNQELGRQGRV